MLKMRYIFLFVIMSLLIIYLAACQATVGGSKGRERYEIKRSLIMPNYWETTVRGDVEHIYNAAISGIKDLDLKILTSKVDRLSGIIEGSFADDKKFNIKLSYESPGVTLIRIRVGLTGEKTLSVMMFEAIEKHF